MRGEEDGGEGEGAGDGGDVIGRRRGKRKRSASAPAASLRSAAVEPALAHHALCITRANTIRVESI